MRSRTRLGSLRLPSAAVLALCWGCGSDPGGPTTPTTTQPGEPTYTVSASVYYDENGNGRRDADELVGVPGVEVVVGNASGRTAAGGRAAVTGVRAGTAAVGLRTESLPTYFQPGPSFSITLPGATEVALPLTLPIEHNHPNLYLGFGDSITAGDGSGDGNGYALRLQALLAGHLGYAEVRKWGRSGDTSAESAELSVIHRTLRAHDPAYTLILFGTNDWHECQSKPVADCYTIEALRTIVEEVRTRGHSLPVLATIPPANPAINPGRNQWHDQMNSRIKALAAEERVLLADLNAEMKSASSLASLFVDDVHPNDAGYLAIAQGWFKAITRARAAASSSGRGRFGFLRG